MVKLFPTSSEHFITHNKGLNIAQIAFLKSLSVGDILILYVNEDGTLTLKKSNLTPKEG